MRASTDSRGLGCSRSWTSETPFTEFVSKAETSGRRRSGVGSGTINQYRVMPFGLVNAAASFQAYINKALHSFLDVFAFVYLDDILTYKGNEREYAGENDLMKEHVSQVKSVLKKLKQFGLYIKLSKCRLHTKEVDFLGFRVSSTGISMQKDRASIVQDWPMPCSHRDVQAFIEFVNFYRRFVDGFSRIAADLTGLLKGALNGKFFCKFEMTAEGKKSFSRFKEAFTTAFMLRHFSPELKTLLETDSSGFAISGNHRSAIRRREMTSRRVLVQKNDLPRTQLWRGGTGTARYR